MADEPAAVVGMANLFDGFEQAFARWQKVERATHDPLQTFIPLFEVLEWTACIDERLGQEKWSSDLRGLRWARHRTRHDWAAALEVKRWQDLVLRPSMVREPPDELAWVEHLPEATPARNRKDEPYYNTYLAGQPARVTLNFMQHLFLVELRPHYPRP